MLWLKAYNIAMGIAHMNIDATKNFWTTLIFASNSYKKN